MLYARSRVVLAARAANLAALDQVYAGVKDDDGFRRDAAFGRRLGYTGKLCVVTRQTELAREIFTPSEEEILRSRRMIAADEAAKANGQGAIDFERCGRCSRPEGALVDEPMLKRAAAIVALAASQNVDA